MMQMIYFLFVLLIILIRFAAGYDSRYQAGKYITIKNNVLSVLLLDRMSSYINRNRLKKDKNKMSVWGLIFYIGLGIVLITNIVFLIVPKIPIDPWVVESAKFIVCADTLNKKISALAVLLLFVLFFGYLGFAIIFSNKKTNPKWLKILIWTVAPIFIAISAVETVYFLIELICCFL